MRLASVTTLGVENAMLRVIGNRRDAIENAEELTPGERNALQRQAGPGAM